MRLGTRAALMAGAGTGLCRFGAGGLLAGWDIQALAVTLPAAVCLIRLAALVLNDHFREPSRALHGLVFSMAARTGLPLVLAVAVHFQDGTLGKAGLLYYLVVFYLISLGIEMPLSLIRPPSRGSSATDARS